MKYITRILALTLGLAIASASAWAQNADAAYKEFRKYRDAKDAAQNASLIPNLSKAGVDFLVNYPSDKNAPKVVNDLLSFGTGTLAKDKNKQAGWFTQVQYELVSRGAPPQAAASAIAALNAAMAEGEVLNNPTMQGLNEWRGKIDTLAASPDGTRYLLDRERAFYNYVMALKGGAKTGEAQLAALANHKDKGIAAWVKQQQAASELGKTPFTIAFTDINGKPFDSTKLKGSPALYVYFWSVTNKNAADDMNKLLDQYYEFGRKQIEFVCVCVDGAGKRDEVLAFVKKNKLKLPIYFDEKGVKELRAKCGNAATPSGYFFDSKGMLVGQPGFKYGDLKKYIK